MKTFMMCIWLRICIWNWTGKKYNQWVFWKYIVHAPVEIIYILPLLLWLYIHLSEVVEVESREKSSLYTYSKVICVLIAFITQTCTRQPPFPRQGNAIVTKNPVLTLPTAYSTYSRYYSFNRSQTQLHFISNS